MAFLHEYEIQALQHNAATDASKLYAEEPAGSRMVRHATAHLTAQGTVAASECLDNFSSEVARSAFRVRVKDLDDATDILSKL